VDIVLTTLNAKYIHAAFGLRYLRANLGALRDRSAIVEFTINERPIDIVERILALQPKIVGIGVYIWNAVESLAVVRMLKQVAPDVVLVLGGPEVSHETLGQPIVDAADYTITSEGEVAFAELANRLLSQRRQLMPVIESKIIAGGQPDTAGLVLPYDEYSDDDLANRVLYVEASRGCPFECEFCLSSLDEKVRNFPLPAMLAALDNLATRGAKQFKFVDRTFNLSPKVSGALLDFFLERAHMGLFAHFEMVPDRFPDALRDRLAKFAPGAVQLEVGIQTFDPATAARISRRQNIDATLSNLAWLHGNTGAHVHADLIVGLPGEDIATFALGFDRLVLAGPHEIQVGILKRLRGTPIIRHDQEFDVVWSTEPPYELLQNRVIRFAEMQRMKRFARAWDLVANRGNFTGTTPLLWTDRNGIVGSPFAGFATFAEWLSAKTSLAAISLPRLTELIRCYLVEHRGYSDDEAGVAMAPDFCHPGASVPKSLQPFVIELQRKQRSEIASVTTAADSRPARQAKHHRAAAEP
jgi:radical SAM superfamily enzyme YgiQ (UPF0313 family)